MAAVGLLTYSYASLQERLYRFTLLRAMGLMRQQIVIQVILEYVFLTVYGAVAGALIGAVASALFVPFFRVAGEGGIPLPPLIPVVAQKEVGWLMAIFMHYGANRSFYHHRSPLPASLQYVEGAFWVLAGISYTFALTVLVVYLAH